jgi:hypothetical protein
VRIRVAVPIHLRVHLLRPGVTVRAGVAALAVPYAKAQKLVSARLAGKADLTLFYDQVYVVRGRVVITAGFVSLGAPFTSTDARRWLQPMYRRAKRVPLAISSPPGTIVLPPPQFTPIQPFSLTLVDPIPTSSAPVTINVPPPQYFWTGPPMVIHACGSPTSRWTGPLGPLTVAGVDIPVTVKFDAGPCPPPIIIVPATPKSCHPNVLDYIDLSFMYDCGGGSAPAAPMGPGGFGTGQFPFIVAFPGITAS